MCQVFSNYGNKSNAELLFSFGFCLRPNAADVVVATLGCPGAETLALTVTPPLRSWLSLPQSTRAPGRAQYLPRVSHAWCRMQSCRCSPTMGSRASSNPTAH
jgi:hypothetical protein